MSDQVTAADLAAALRDCAEKLHIWHYDGVPVTTFEECGWAACRTNAARLAAYDAAGSDAGAAARAAGLDYFLKLSRELWPYVGGWADKERAIEWRRARQAVEAATGFVYTPSTFQVEIEAKAEAASALEATPKEAD